MLIRFIFKFIILLTFVNSAISQEVLFSKAELAADLIYLKEQLHRRHPNLYTYSTPDQINGWFQDQIKNLPDSINDLQAFALVASISPLIMDGHSYVYPGGKYLNYFFGGAPLFPLDVYWVNDSLKVLRNYHVSGKIEPGAIITRINSLDVNQIRNFIVNRLSRDGKNSAYAEYLFSVFFQAWIAAFYGFEEEYIIDFTNLSGKQEQLKLKGLSRNQLQAIRKDFLAGQEKGLRLHLNRNNRSALMTIQSFSNDIIRHEFKQNFRKEMKHYFKQIQEDSINLVFIDLRGNQGGELKNGIELLKYFMLEKFIAVESFHRIKLNKTGERESIKFTNKWNSEFAASGRYHFSGRLVLLTDGGSFSCASIVAHVFRKYARGKIWGEMTGGSQHILSGSPNRKIKLPNTGIQFSIPLTGYVLSKKVNKESEGIVPDFNWSPALPERLMNDSERLNLLNNLHSQDRIKEGF